MPDYDTEVGTKITYMTMNADPQDNMKDLLDKFEQSVDEETDYRSSYLNEIVINENDDGSYAVNMFFVEWGPFVNDLDIAGEAEMMRGLPKQAMSGSVKSFTKGRFGQKQHLPTNSNAGGNSGSNAGGNSGSNGSNGAGR